MNKKIKRTIAVALTVSAFSAIAPATNFNLMTTKAYASSSDYKLDDITLEADGSDVDLYEKSSYKKKLDSSKELESTYYAKVRSSKRKVEVKASGGDGKILIFKDGSSTAYKEGAEISLSSGKTTLYINSCDDDQYDAEKKNKKQKQYKLVIQRGNSSRDDDDDDEKGDAYLRSISLSDGDLSFSRKTSKYDVNVATSVDEVKITAKPDCSKSDYDDYEVRIDGTEVDDSDSFKRTVSLNKGKNEIKITVEDKDKEEKRTYTLNINRGGTGSTSSTNKESSTATSDVKINQWVNVNGNMQYNDGLGNPLKNVWFTDPSTGNRYYLEDNGYKKIGWLSNGGKWYYLDGNGIMKTGWQVINGSWYILDGSGAMITGWYRDMNGTWYYLQSSGAMQTGWLLDGGKWYFLNSNGSMATNTTIGGYRLGSNGAWTR